MLNGLVLGAGSKPSSSVFLYPANAKEIRNVFVYINNTFHIMKNDNERNTFFLRNQMFYKTDRGMAIASPKGLECAAFQA